MFNAGDVVKCVDDRGSAGDIVGGQGYTVLYKDYFASCVWVLGKRGIPVGPYHHSRFVLAPKTTDALSVQEGGSHYKSMKIQPVEYIVANDIGYMEGNVIKYVSRWKNKNGVEDLKKARHYIDLLIEQQEKNATNTN